MRRLLQTSLQAKLTATLAAAALIFSIIAGGTAFIRTYVFELERIHESLGNLATTVHSSASIAAFVGNETIAQDVSDGLLKNKEILSISIEGKSGFRHVRSKPSIESDDWKDEFVLHYPLYSPVSPQDKIEIGQLKILTNAALITAQAQKAAMLQLLFLVAQTILIATLLGYAYRRLIGQPLAKLTQQLTGVEPGSSLRVQIHSKDEHNEIGMLASSVNRYLDASERALRAEREMLERVTTLEHHYRRIFESTKVGVMVLDMNGGLINCNSAVSDRVGERMSPDPTPYPLDHLNRVFSAPKKAWQLIEKARASGQVASGDLELLDSEDNPGWAHCLFSIGTFTEDKLNYIEAVFYDVTSRRIREDNALRSAERDALTDLVNRRGANEYLERCLADARHEDRSLALFFLDLDGFKQVNDKYGHAAGDTVLLEVARRLRKARRRTSDLLARFGGDEFVIAAYGIHKADDAAHEIAQAMLDAMKSPICLEDGHEVNIGISIGIASYPENANEVADLIDAADQAMYEAKNSGKNGYRLATSSPPESAG